MDPASGDTVGADVDGRFPVRRSGSYLRPDNSRMLLRPFHPGSDQPARDTIQRILAMPESAAEVELRRVMAHFSHEHADIDAVFIDRCRQLSHLLPTAPPSHGQSLLIGAYFMREYSLQLAALFNPSIVPHPDQAGVPADAVRFIMSLRAVGEGHLSSIEFRGGSIGGDGTLTFDPVAGSVTTPALRYPAIARSISSRPCWRAGWTRRSSRRSSAICRQCSTRRC